MSQTPSNRKEAIPKKFKKKDPREMAFKAFILPQYQDLCEYNFLNNNLPQKCTAQQCKQKIKDINAMIKSSEGRIKEVEQANSDQSQLKNQQTTTWLTKRYFDKGNRKYFGDNEDEFQQQFLGSIFETICKHLQTNKQIPIQNFHKLLASYQLPVSFKVLSKIYEIIDLNKDGQLNLTEFYSFNKNDKANQIYLEELKNEENTLTAASPFKPTSLSALCIFVSFRINHDFLTEFLYHGNFQVKDKSLGLLNMLDIVKLQGQMRIKNDNDKRIIRQFKVGNSAILGSNNPISQRSNEQKNENEPEIDAIPHIPHQHINLGNQEIPTHFQVKDQRRESQTTDAQSQFTYSCQDTPAQKQQSQTSIILPQQHTPTIFSSKAFASAQESPVHSNKSKSKLKILSKNAINSEYYPDELAQTSTKKSSLERSYNLSESKKNIQGNFEKQISNLIEKANKKGEMIAQRTFETNQGSIREILDMEAQKLNSSKNLSESSFSYRSLSHGLILPSISEQKQKHSSVTSSREVSSDIAGKYKGNSISHRSLHHRTSHEFNKDMEAVSSKEKINKSKLSIQISRHGSSNFNNQGQSYSKNTGSLMEHTLLESETSRQVMMGMKLMKQDDSIGYSPLNKSRIFLPTTKNASYQQVKHILSPFATPNRQFVNSNVPQ